MKKLSNEEIRKIGEYAIIVAAKKGIEIPSNSYGEIEWVKFGKGVRAKSVTFNIPHRVKIDIPHWDFVPKKAQKQLL